MVSENMGEAVIRALEMAVKAFVFVCGIGIFLMCHFAPRESQRDRDLKVQISDLPEGSSYRQMLQMEQERKRRR